MYYTEHTKVFLNGKWKEVSEINSHLYSQTMQYGIGAFEGMRAYATPLGTQVFKGYEHYDRLVYSAERLGIKVRYRVDELVAITYELLDKNNLKNAYIRPLIFMEDYMSLQISRKSNTFICAWEWGPLLGRKLLNVVTSSYEKPNPKSCFIDAKITGQYVNSIIAVNEAKSKGYDEALLCDTNGNVAQGPGANFFYEKDNILYTAPKGNILPGITRSTIIELARDLGITIKEQLFKIEDVQGADGAFFTGTAAEVIGLKTLNDVPFKKEWENTHGSTLQNAYKGLVRSAEAHVIDVV